MRNVRPSPAAAALLLGAILGSGVAVGVVAAEATHPDPSSSSSEFRGPLDMGPGRGMHGDMDGHWDHGGPHHP